jgi:hypothetical protein
MGIPREAATERAAKSRCNSYNIINGGILKD